MFDFDRGGWLKIVLIILAAAMLPSVVWVFSRLAGRMLLSILAGAALYYFFVRK